MSISLTDFSWVNEIASDDAIQQLSWGETPTLQGPWDQDKLYAWYNYLMDDRVYVDDLDAKRFIAFDKWKNDVLLPQFAVEMLPHFFASWARNLIAATLLYHGVGLIWSLWIYVLNGKKYFPKNDIPTLSTIWQQMKVSQLAILWYTFLPAVDEWFVERGFGMAYYSVPEFGWWRYLAFTAVYLVWVEFGIYWVHRLLHEIKWAYRWLHHDHHIYNTKDTLSPFAGLAFHPLDGILQASPYVVGIFFIPCNFLTHQLMLFFTAIWTANIHDCIQTNLEPIMGASYHTYHHLYYNCNYGQFFIFWDWFYGTLRVPYGSSWYEFDGPQNKGKRKKEL
eukprot:gb/GECG01003533.1/.p1 GENE.gb/GECG01003533.1/~~gb/GECG01003533.1/.p1  ORF type:complete len:335 (+),score=18.83 gb/GECG01003533.1/:1-1005(+)